MLPSLLMVPPDLFLKLFVVCTLIVPPWLTLIVPKLFIKCGVVMIKVTPLSITNISQALICIL